MMKSQKIKGSRSKIEEIKDRDNTFFEKSIITFPIRLTGAMLKSHVQLWHIIPPTDFYY